MAKWNLKLYVVNFSKSSDAASISERDYRELDKISEEGWELVSVTPIDSLGYTPQLLFTFKRPEES
jgi:hypothetical protein